LNALWRIAHNSQPVHPADKQETEDWHPGMQLAPPGLLDHYLELSSTAQTLTVSPGDNGASISHKPARSTNLNIADNLSTWIPRAFGVSRDLYS
jgi:hypothetical protein